MVCSTGIYVVRWCDRLTAKGWRGRTRIRNGLSRCAGRSCVLHMSDHAQNMAALSAHLERGKPMYLALASRRGRRATYAPGSDLSSLSCIAGTELDDLLLGLTEQLPAVERLVDLISKSAERNGGKAVPDPTTVVLMKGALDQSGALGRELQCVADVVEGAKEISRLLKEVTTEPILFRERRCDTLKALRRFCFDLSRGAGARRPSPDAMRSRYRYRR